jgi:hypothetical protein
MDIFIGSARPILICANVSLSGKQSLISCFDLHRGMSSRRPLIEATGPSFGNLSQMLGGKPEIVGDSCVANGRAWKLGVKMVRSVIVFAMETGGLAPEG